MGNKTEIAWTDATWNPVSGCTQASPGCDHCYAARLAKRLPVAHAGGRPFSEVVCHPERLDVPIRWRKPRRIFVCSMGDLFHDGVPFDFVDSVWGRMLLANQHTFQVLTKRPAKMLEYLSTRRWTPDGSNVWLGVTAEDQQRADERIPLLLQCPAAVRLVSVEPMLGPVDLSGYGWMRGLLTEPRISWVICGGESGSGARPMHPAWARSLRDQCSAAGVPFFFKQQGGNNHLRHVRILDGVTHDAFPGVTP
jgi:protein gp37